MVENEQEFLVNSNEEFMFENSSEIGDFMLDDSTELLFNSEYNTSLDPDIEENSGDKNEWINTLLYENSGINLGNAISRILKYFIKNSLTKTALYELMDLLDFFLPKPNNLPKTKYQFNKIINKILPNSNNVIQKHRICEKCSGYIGKWNDTIEVTTCENCDSSEVKGIFVEYDLKSVLKNALEHQNLSDLLKTHQQSVDNNSEDYISDITSGSKYKYLKRYVIPGILDIVLLWGIDGVPISNSSRAEIWLLQVEVVNIPFVFRRNFQYVCGVYYSREKKPDASSFLIPFAESMKDLFNGIVWKDKKNICEVVSKVVAPIASCDAPAKAAAQELMQHNGEESCPLCEHPGIEVKTGNGHCRVFPNRGPQIQRTRERMINQALEVREKLLLHSHGVKGPSVGFLIPHFDPSISFPVDYLHAVLLGIMRMLLSLWFNPKYKHKEFYINKSDRDEINKDLMKVTPPDSITHVPRDMKYMKYLKGSELEDGLLHYYPILLKGKLPKKYYDHFLLLVYGIHALLKRKIHDREIDHAEFLLNKFVTEIEDLYGLNKCSWNAHQVIFFIILIDKLIIEFIILNF